MSGLTPASAAPNRATADGYGGNGGWRRFAGLSLCVLLALACSGCSGLSHGFLAPQGPVAADQRYLLLLVIGLTLVVVIPVIVLMPWVVWRYRRKASKSEYRPEWEFSLPLEILAWGVPLIVVAILGYILWGQAHKLDPYRALPSNQAPLQVQVVGLDWKWLFIYPQQHIATVNQLAIPVGRPVHLTMTSDTVMLSLLIPRLAGQIYAMAGMKTQLNLQADHPGRFRGENTQYNGRGFQNQKFDTLAMSDADFAQWVASVRRSDLPLTCMAYGKLEKKSVIDTPRRYAEVQPGLFRWVVAKYTVYPTPACGADINENDHE